MWGNWRDSYIHGTLVIWPPDDVRAVVNSLRERCDRVSASISEAHITMTQPFVRKPSDAELAVIDDVVSRYEPLEIEFGPLGTFLPYPCLFFTVEPVGPLTALHDALQVTELFRLAPSHHERFVPDMSILEGTLDSGEIVRLADELRETAPTGSFACRENVHVVPDASFRFSVARRFRIGTELPLSS